MNNFKPGDILQIGDSLKATVYAVKKETRIGLQYEGRRIQGYLLEVNSLPDNTVLVEESKDEPCTDDAGLPEETEG